MRDSLNPSAYRANYRTSRKRTGWHSLALTVALLGAFNFMGCGSTGSGSGSSSGGSGSGSGQAQLSLSVSSVAFGNVALGSMNSQPVMVSNTGNASASISQMTASGTGFSINGPTLPLTLPAGQSTTVNVVFTPANHGAFSGSLSVVSNATNSPATVPLSGTAHAEVLNWDASTSTVAGYNVYRSTQSGGPYTKLNSALIASTTFTDITVQAGQTLFYVVTAVNSNGVESSDSNQSSATIPSP